VILPKISSLAEFSNFARLILSAWKQAKLTLNIMIWLLTVYKWFANIFATPELLADVFASVAQLDRVTA
jgi:hypothetical protein